MLLVKLTSGDRPKKPAIFIDACIHAREWITTSTVLYLIDQIVTSEPGLTKNVDWFIVPVWNIDGYQFSHEKVILLTTLTVFDTYKLSF